MELRRPLETEAPGVGHGGSVSGRREVLGVEAPDRALALELARDVERDLPSDVLLDEGQRAAPREATARCSA